MYTRLGVWRIGGYGGYSFVKNVDHFFRKIYPPYHGGYGGVYFQSNRHFTEIDSLSVVDFFRRLLRLLIIIRSDIPIFLTDEQLVCFQVFLCRASLLVSPDSWIPPLALCFQVLLLRLRFQSDKQRKFFGEEKVRFPTTSPTSYIPSSH